MGDWATFAEHARGLTEQGDLDGALSQLEMAVQASPNEVGPWSSKGLLHERRGEIDKALECFRRSTQIKPTYCDRYNVGNMLLHQAKLEQALPEFEAAIRLKPDYAEAHVNRGIVLTQLGRTEEAKTCFETAIGHDDRLANAWRCLAILLQTGGQLDSAEQAYQRAAELNPNDAKGWYELGWSLATLPPDNRIELEPTGRERRAYAAFDKVIQLQPQYRDAWINKGTC